MKVLVLLSLVALCISQSTITGRYVSVKPDGTIILVGEHGKELDINRNTVNPRIIDLILRTPYGLVKKFHIEEIESFHNVDFSVLGSRLPYWRNLGDEFSQHDILVHLFKQYEGIKINEDKFALLLEDIHQLVKYGVLNPSVMTVLQYFDQYVPKYQQWGSEYLSHENGVGKYENIEYTPEYETAYGKYEHTVNPWMKFFHSLNQQKSSKVGHCTPYQWQYQIHQEYPYSYTHQQEYPYGHTHQQEYPYGYTHQQVYPQWYSQKWEQEYPQWSSQKLEQEYPQWYTQKWEREYPQTYYHQQTYPNQMLNVQNGWNLQQYHKYPVSQEYQLVHSFGNLGKVPKVY